MFATFTEIMTVFFFVNYRKIFPYAYNAPILMQYDEKCTLIKPKTGYLVKVKLKVKKVKTFNFGNKYFFFFASQIGRHPEI